MNFWHWNTVITVVNIFVIFMNFIMITKFLLQNFLDHSLDLALQNHKKPMNHKNLARSQKLRPQKFGVIQYILYVDY